MPASPALPATPNQAKFFGLDLGSLWLDLRTAWRDMLEWRLFSWVWPRQAVRVCLPDGGQAMICSLHGPLSEDERRAASTRFEAVLLPEKLLLRRAIELPKLQSAELMAALGLEVRASSPFSVDDVIWAHEISPRSANSLRVHVVLTSRKLTERHIESVRPQLQTQIPEVWVAHADGPGFVVLPGFGEARRHRQGALWRWVSGGLALLALMLVAVMIVTPSIQLYLRFAQANQSMQVLQRQAAPVIAQREALIRASEQLASLSSITGRSVPILQTLKLITDALPDDTSLLSLQIQGPKVSMSGQTANAAALMKQLGSTPGLHDVKAPTPATKPLGAPRESFTIELSLEPIQLRPAS